MLFSVGVFIMTLSENDINFHYQIMEDLSTVLKSIRTPAINFDQLTRKHCLDLEHFVIFSSISSGNGVEEQPLIGMAHSANENLCERRRKEGLPALAIQWGPVNETGSAENCNINNKVKSNL